MKDIEIIELSKHLKERSYHLAKEALPKLRQNDKPATPYNYKKFYEESESGDDKKERDLYESMQEEEILEKESIKNLLEKYFFGIFKGKYDDLLLKLLYETKKTKSTIELFEKTAAIVQALFSVSHTQNSLNDLTERSVSLKNFTTGLHLDMTKTASRLEEGVKMKKIEHEFAKDIGEQLSETVEKSKQVEAEFSKKEKELMKILQLQQQAFEESVEELQKKLEETQRIVYTDALTGIYNRRAFDEEIAKELKLSLEKNRPCALAIIDIDDFKKINDTFGHQIGDHALTHIARMVKGSIKNSDFLARYGGEEFVVIFPNTRYPNALSAAENIRKNIEEENFTVRGQPVRITVSIGVSEVARHRIEDVRDMVHYADKALYECKATGKNKVR
ncbi:MAG: GGDEF domain-containing protein [Nitrospinae bacterium]|nr:GGDEF domain-containing protein [Nitrospinota bacterium]